MLSGTYYAQNYASIMLVPSLKHLCPASYHQVLGVVARGARHPWKKIDLKCLDLLMYLIEQCLNNDS